MDRRRREAYQKGLSEGLVENYVSYNEMPTAGYRRERFLIDNPEFTKAMGLNTPDRLPSKQYDILLEKPNKTPEDQLRMDAYKLYLPDDQIENYVAYNSLSKVQSPLGNYEDDWFLIEHPDFYKFIKQSQDWQTRDFRNVPSREVFALYQRYYGLSEYGTAREDFRRAHKELDDWLVQAKGLKKVGPTKTITPKTTTSKSQYIEKKRSEEELAKRILTLTRR